MKRTNYTYLTPTEPAALLATLSDRVGEYNAMQGDRRALISLKSCDTDAGTFTLCVREGTIPALNLDLACTATAGEGGYGFSLVLSLIRLSIFGCSPGAYPARASIAGRK